MQGLAALSSLCWGLVAFLAETLSGDSCSPGAAAPLCCRASRDGRLHKKSGFPPGWPPGQPPGMPTFALPGWGAPEEQDPILEKISVPHPIPLPGRGLCCPDSSQHSPEPGPASSGGSNPAECLGKAGRRCGQGSHWEDESAGPQPGQEAPQPQLLAQGWT